MIENNLILLGHTLNQIQLKIQEVKQMGNLRDEAQAYTPKQTLNIADLDRVDLTWNLEDRSGTDSEGKEFDYKVMVVNSIEYRVPNSVLEEVKKILKLKPDTKFVKVSKSGSGLSTRYSVEVVE